jgi:hypothetical protein
MEIKMKSQIKKTQLKWLLSFNKSSSTHSGTNAHGDDSELSIGSLELGQESGNLSGTSATEWVAKGDSTSSWVHFLVVKAELVGTPGGLGSEGFIELENINLVLGDACLLENLWNGKGWSDTHNLWRNTSNGVGNELSNDWPSVLFGERSSGEEDGSSTVSGLGGVSGSGDTVLAERRLELAESFEGGLSSDAVILGDGDIGRVSILVLVDGVDWDDLVIEPSTLLSVGSSSVAFNCKLVENISLESVLLSNVLSKGEITSEVWPIP